ncbi:MAG: sigma-70 family RNA polymerase sigma factor [Solirubrobacteraceae bacterium]
MSQRDRVAGVDLRERLIESHLPLVKALARRYTGLGAELDDLVQVGTVGLIKASDRFDPQKGVAFAAFAAPTIEGEIRHHLRDRSSGLRIPRRLQHLSREIRRCQGQLTNRLGRLPTTTELAAVLDADPDEVERALAAERAREPVPLTGRDRPPVGGAGADPASDSDSRLMLVNSLRALDERERRIIYLRFHADKTERQIAIELGLSQAHVSRLLSAALAKLRDSLAPEGAGDHESPADIASKLVISPAFSGSGASRSSTAHRREGAQPPSKEAGTGPSRERRPAAADQQLDARPGRRGTTASQDGAKPSGHSGRFLVRMPSALHGELANAAQREHVSLNQFVTNALATTVSASRDGREDPPVAGRPPARTIRLVLAANLAVVILAVAVAVLLLVLAFERGI